MPTSDAQGREWVAEILDQIGNDLKLIVDVGPGNGTYERVFRAQTPNARWKAIEIWGPYIERFELEKYYDQVILGNVMDWPFEKDTDLVILGDVVEHLEKNDALLLLYELKQRVKHIIVSLPIVESIQGECEGNPYEAHLTQWTFDEMLELMTPCHAWRGDVLGRFWWSCRRG